MDVWPQNFAAVGCRSAWLEAMLEYVFKRPVSSDAQDKATLKLEDLDDFIDFELENLSKGQVAESDYGRLGPNHVMFDICSNVGTFIFNQDRLGVSSQSNFNTIRATCCVFKGKWQYELMLGSKGVMQVGWVTNNCKFSQEKGVGDTIDSYAFDGNRVRKWNVATYTYGEAWVAGDVIGCCIDLDKGTVHFYRNGRSMGEAFSNVRLGPGLAYFPAVSLAFGENLVANFGATPLRHPVEGYRPLEKTSLRDAERARLLLLWTKRLLPVYEEVHKGASQPAYLTDGLDVFRQGTKAQALLIAAPVLRRLGPLLASSHVTEVSFLPFLFQVFEESPDGRRISTLLELFWALLEPPEIKKCLENVAVALLTGFRFSPCTPDFLHQKRHLCLMLSVLQHDSSRRYLLESILFDKIKFAMFMEVKPPDNETLATLIPDVWFELMEEVHPTEETYRKNLYAAAKQRLKVMSADIENIQLRILEQLTVDTDAPQGQTSRDLFLAKFEAFVKENTPGSRTLTLDLCPNAVALAFFHRLLALVRRCLPVFHTSSGQLLQEHNLYIPAALFMTTIGTGPEVSHVGDTPDQRIVASEIPIPPSNRTVRPMQQSAGGNTVHVENETSATAYEAKEEDKSIKILQLLDGIVRLYCLCGHAQFVKMSAVKDNMRDYLRAVQEVRRNSAWGERDVAEALSKVEQVFGETLSEQARHVAWLSVVVFSKEKQNDIYWLLNIVLKTLEEASSAGVEFCFVPEYHVEACMKLLTTLSVHFLPTCQLSDIPGHYHVLVRYSTFLAEHFADRRVVNPDVKDALLRALAAHVCPPSTVRALECMPTKSSLALIQALLQPYKNRPWAQTNWILMRLWKGCGYAFRYTVAPHLVERMASRPVESTLPNHPAPCPSVFFQNHIGRWLEDHPEPASAFLGSVLTQLNWSFSQFISMLQEIQNAQSRPERVFINSQQLKICATCFDLSLGLLRVLEMIVNVAPSLVTNPTRPHSELLLARIFQVLSHILNRVTSRCGCFDLVVGMDVAGLEAIDHFPIVAAVTGILVALLLKGSVESRETALSGLLAEPCFQLSSLEFLLGGGPTSLVMQEGASEEADTANDSPVFSLANYSEVKEEEVEQARQLVQLVQSRQPPPVTFDEDHICTICYAQGNSVRFVPCGHQSCHVCILTHLANSKECFFCKAVVEKLDPCRTIPPQ
ncbi:E3 ubiquitin-protein ligase RNF123-like [Dermacentor albipictus]|uniref:E3 ubiquitin-protein ligase RNF123-like n=1 Tax=Dermacentor albipictus TaxID=60249 RepID=UPI0038FD06F2